MNLGGAQDLALVYAANRESVETAIELVFAEMAPSSPRAERCDFRAQFVGGLGR